jgi:methanogenic corrinoid protein MtbC1
MSSFRSINDLHHWPSADGAWMRGSFEQTLRHTKRKETQRGILSSAIESEILPRLMRSRSGNAAEEIKSDGPSAREIDDFTSLLLSPDHARAAEKFIDSLRARETSLEVVFTELFSGSARLLGKLWEDDTRTFTDVTIALSRLQRLLSSLAAEFVGTPARQRGAPIALLTAMPGDQHTFGIFMVREFYRRAGWRVRDGFYSSSDELIQAIKSEPITLVGLSVGCDASVGALTALLRNLRQTCPNRNLNIQVGGRFFLENPGLAARVGADSMAPAGRPTVPKLSSLLDTIPMRY